MAAAGKIIVEVRDAHYQEKYLDALDAHLETLQKYKAWLDRLEVYQEHAQTSLKLSERATNKALKAQVFVVVVAVWTLLYALISLV